MPRLTRPKENKIQRNKVLIVCGGHTEKWYFDKIKSKSLFEVESIKIKRVDDDKTKPMDVVKEAIRLKKGFDYIYAVFDKDSFEDFDLALEYSKQNEIIPIYSNQAFELWIYYHFGFFCGVEHRDKLILLIENYISTKSCVVSKKYKKSDLSNIWCVLEPNILKAIENSKKSVQYHNLVNIKAGGYEKISSRESSTNVYELMSRIYKE